MRAGTTRLLRDGLIAGCIGYAVVVLFVSAIDAFRGRPPFHTAAALGSALFYGLEDPAQLVMQPGPVLAYNGLHLVVFLVLGLIMAWLARLAERGPQFWFIAAALFMVVLPHAFGFPIWFSGVVSEVISFWLVVIAASAAALAMGAWFWFTHPLIRARAIEPDDG